MNKIEKGSMNVYADLGIAGAEEMLVKAQLATKIGEIIKLRKMTQIQASSCWECPSLSFLICCGAGFAVSQKPRCLNA
ncbi:MAG TPA: hypothetical protein VJL10_11225 [Anaerolineales bacterium]|nr:hypothetical protein [Candidatus Hodarchaeales archaeon]HLA88588.1 hypothetical protein [Anaerolineales bacterium]